MTFDSLENLTACIEDVLSEDNITPDKILNAIRTAVGESVAHHKKMAEKGQRVLDGLNAQPVTFGVPTANELYPQYAPDVDFNAAAYWGHAGGHVKGGEGQDHISFTNTSDPDTISLG